MTFFLEGIEWLNNEIIANGVCLLLTVVIREFVKV